MKNVDELTNKELVRLGDLVNWLNDLSIANETTGSYNEITFHGYAMVEGIMKEATKKCLDILIAELEETKRKMLEE